MGLGLSSLRLGLGANSAAEPPAFAIAFTGLTDGEARPGDHASIGYSIDPDNGTETLKWSNSSNPADAATYGTGASPTDYTAGDEGSLWLHVTDGGETVSRSARIRYAPGSVTESSLPDITIDDDPVDIDFASDFTTTNLTGTYVITGLPTGVVDDGDGTASGTATPATPGSLTSQVTSPTSMGAPLPGPTRRTRFTARRQRGALTLTCLSWKAHPRSTWTSSKIGR
jgi:hypothetical protein